MEFDVKEVLTPENLKKVAEKFNFPMKMICMQLLVIMASQPSSCKPFNGKMTKKEGDRSKKLIFQKQSQI